MAPEKWARPLPLETLATTGSKGLDGLEKHLVMMHDPVLASRPSRRSDQQSDARQQPPGGEAHAHAAHRFPEAAANHLRN